MRCIVTTRDKRNLLRQPQVFLYRMQQRIGDTLFFELLCFDAHIEPVPNPFTREIQAYREPPYRWLTCSCGKFGSPQNKTMEEHPLKTQLIGMLLLCAAAPSVFAADYSLRSECTRQNQSYSEKRIVEQVAGLYGHRFGTDTAGFRLSGDPFNYYAIPKSSGSTIIDLMIKAHDTQHAVNICVRASDGFIYGVELAQGPGGS